MASLALIYSLQGRYGEAEYLATQVLEIRKTVLEEEHPDVLMSMSDLARYTSIRGCRDIDRSDNDDKEEGLRSEAPGYALFHSQPGCDIF